MNLGRLREMAVQLIDEFSNNPSITDDEDIRLKLNNLFDIAQTELSLIRKIDKVYEFTVEEVGVEEYNTFDLPDDFMELKKIRFFPQNRSLLDYYVQGKKIKTYKDCLGKFEVEYHARPQTINNETSDDYELDLDLEAQLLLPYYVASDVLKSDVSANYTAFEAKYKDKLEMLNASLQRNDVFVKINNLFGEL